MLPREARTDSFAGGGGALVSGSRRAHSREANLDTMEMPAAAADRRVGRVVAMDIEGMMW